MKKVLSLFLAAMLSVSLLAVVSASKYNPFFNQYKQEASQLHQVGVVKNVFVIFDEKKQQINADIKLTYRDQAGQIKKVQENQEGRIFINFKKPGYMKLMKLSVADVEYEILGKDVFEDFDYDDIVEGRVDFNVIQINTKNNVAYIYDAD